ncbi:hypothetical protein DS901_16960 [Loktanella sp. D2R18]|uniref:hypothetical protein n=1 Tax=Rhodobacterales TaxID=204455 RepID=UPI000DEA314B|nr:MULTISPECIES: hypothetical protein [Rhodobacterales]MDO6591161.1 hypothetical protein [Yoonia sp. 1_MG-2023]RBW41431.1 hypothetical protein DS901_16960 [Loktanella sp. D2R18]
MDVSAIFKKDFRGELGEAVWLVDTPENRNRFEKSCDLDPNSALFSVNGFNTLQSGLAETVWSIHDHYPDLDKIIVIGVKLSALIAKELDGDYILEGKKMGSFAAQRMAPKSRLSAVSH